MENANQTENARQSHHRAAQQSEEGTQTEDIGENPASQGEICEPRRDLSLGRLESMISKLRSAQIQSASVRKRARRARNRREKRRKEAALAEETQGNGPVTGPADHPEHSEAPVPISITTDDWIPPDPIETVELTGAEELDGNRKELKGDSSRELVPPQPNYCRRKWS
jgi:hypothetical protein